jgi:predicted transcriptional regulator
MQKQEVLSILDHLPDPLDPEELMHELYLKAKIDRAEAAIARGEVVSQEEVERRSREWFASSGLSQR